LTPDGLNKTREVARGFAALADAPQLYLSSPYVRALQTAEIFAEVLRHAKAKIEKSEHLLPGAEPAAFFRELSRELARKKTADRVICFGHAPQLDELIAFALGSKRDLTALKKAGAACIELSRVHPPSGTLLWLMAPRALRKLQKRK
jgi:phosphohistidine phosphatase